MDISEKRIVAQITRSIVDFLGDAHYPSKHDRPLLDSLSAVLDEFEAWKDREYGGT